MHNNYVDNYKSFYFIGIGGVSMSSLAKLLLDIGKTVGGYDANDGEYVRELKNLGVEIAIGSEEDNLELFDVVIYTDAIKENDARLVKAKNLSKLILPRGQFLREVSKLYKTVIAVSGCHGKTTCTSMLAHIFYAAGKSFTAHIGGCDLKFDNFYASGRDFFITEACEYKKNFLLLKPDISVILNSDADHLECYGSEEEVRKAYVSFAESSKISITLYGDLPTDMGVTFGYDRQADFYAKNIVSHSGKYEFILCEKDKEFGKIRLNVYGKHNVINAVAAAAAARNAGISFEKIKEGLSGYSGVARRFEFLGKYNGAECIADYAHHPNEIKAVLRTATKITEGKLFVIFQPHTYSRTKLLFKQFVSALSSQKILLIYRTFAAREYFDDAGSALTLSQSLKKSAYGDSPEDIMNFLSDAGEKDKVLFLGAGDIYYLAKSIVKD